MTAETDKALAQLAAARLRLFNASQQREAVVLRRVPVDDEKAFEALNVEIAAARDDVTSANAAVQAAMDAAAAPTDPGGAPAPVPPDPVQDARDTALDALITMRDALQKLD
jgi:hypothetical protein